MKTCPICKIGTIQDNAKTSLAVEKEGTLIVIKNADAQICDNCGEIFHTTTTAKQILSVTEKAVLKGAELELVKL
ncbi:MAG TPA: YgiT-type zinc finger protein [Chitinophagales bacterium]|jgi:YgiT-type zinc finger domain-containing protein|nr:YgiT-type zinc finger protein [Chitinophagales bacterium]HQW79156.1 YgiT-type zinc finger protein [Chitinophagales bacterium]